VLKNSKNPHSHFSANIRCIGKVGPSFTEGAVRALHIAKALIWPPLNQNFQLALCDEVFRCFSVKTEFFNTIGSVPSFAAERTKVRKAVVALIFVERPMLVEAVVEVGTSL
jgi:hypothetical protein